jgi:hypothetical protein
MNTTIDVKPTPAEMAAIQTAERKVNRAKERHAESAAMLRRKREDAELTGTPVNADEIARLTDMVEEDRALVEKLEGDLRSAIDAPALRAEKEKRGAELLSDAQTLVSRISAAMESIAPLMLEAVALDEQIKRECANPQYPGFAMLTAPFKDDESRRLLDRLRYWAKERGERGDVTLFSDKLKTFRALSEPPKPAPVLEHRPTLKRRAGR